MLPPDPPITRIPPDVDSSIVGDIEDGGCSPKTKMAHKLSLKRNKMTAFSNVYIKEVALSEKEI